VIKATCKIEIQKAAGVVAVVAFGGGRRVEYGFSNRGIPVMTAAAVAENFLMVDEADADETVRTGAVAGNAIVAGRDVSLQFGRYRGEVSAVTVDAVTRQAGVKRSCCRGLRGDHLHQLALAGDTFGADHELGDVGALGVCGKTGRGGSCILQLC